ncbi:hypothetical protein [Streptomyces arenae]|uniref:hypothetical protein n=1 Tax=Streptomyces arenae TaxID=29301 RepID=UPI0026586361|nr:hypothetical protein [Streptomyces arenae]MCG7207145.1 hypothetical protein [Streptomyces arenae]
MSEQRPPGGEGDTPETDLAEIEEMCAVATPGPWFVRNLDDSHAMNLRAVSTVADTGRGERWPDFDHRELIAATLLQEPRHVDCAEGEGHATETSTFAYHLRSPLGGLVGRSDGGAHDPGAEDGFFLQVDRQVRLIPPAGAHWRDVHWLAHGLAVHAAALLSLHPEGLTVRVTSFTFPLAHYRPQVAALAMDGWIRQQFILPDRGLRVAFDAGRGEYMSQWGEDTALSRTTLRFEFSVAENVAPPPSGFDLGHMDVRGDRGAVSSRDRTPGQAMMIYLSLSLLLDRLRSFLSGRGRTFTTAAIDSSFSLTFRRRKDGSIETLHDGMVIHRSSAADLASAVHTAAERFAGPPLPLLPEDDAGREDLEKSLAEFGDFVTRLPRGNAGE